jgi:hypothetical protein
VPPILTQQQSYKGTHQTSKKGRGALGALGAQAKRKLAAKCFISQHNPRSTRGSAIVCHAPGAKFPLF